MITDIWKHNQLEARKAESVSTAKNTPGACKALNDTLRETGC